MKVLRQILESFRFAVQSVVVGKMRTLLSLLGITIGIFAIISVFTVIDAMENGIRSNLNSIGTNILYIGRWPWAPEEGKQYEWWTYASRSRLQTSQAEELFSQVPTAQAVALALSFNRTVKNGARSMERAEIMAATQDYDQVRKTEIEQGRYFTPQESRSGAAVTIIGATMAENLFDTEDPIGKYVTINNHRTTVIGVFKREGSNMFGLSYDEQLLIPYNYARNFVNLLYMDKDIIIKGNPDVELSDFKAEVTSVMRRMRRLSPEVPDDFTVNEVTGMMKLLDNIFLMINMVGGIIGLFSILVGGFGVANIMFVSVRERTAQIGIQKALGAKSYSILLQFTFEAIMLSVVGGALGLLLIWGGAAIVSSVSTFEITLTMKNILIGLGISSFIGAVAGIFPAWAASRLNPVTAITKN